MMGRNPPKFPPLPVRPLETTLSKYIKSVKPFLSEEEFEKTKNITENFLKNEGKVLQELLEKRAKAMDNWLEEWWVKVAYLQNRNSVVAFSNPGQVWTMKPFSNEDESLRCAATMIFKVLQFNQILEMGLVPQEKAGEDLIDMSQIYQFLGTSRIPLALCDALQFIDETSRSSNVVVMANNHVFSLTVIDSKRKIASIEEIYSMLLDVSKESKTEGVPIGVLTSDNRDHWARAYTLLCRNENNLRNIKEIESALVIVNLDKPLPPCNWKDQLTKTCYLTLHGNGFSRGNAGNRWFDKSLQLIVGAGEDGLGLNGEHSSADGTPVAALAMNLVDSLEKIPPISPAKGEYSKPKKLTFEVTPEIEEAIAVAGKNIDKLMEDLDLCPFKFEQFGRNGIKALKASPDTFVQIAIQFAFYKVHGKPGAQYESASLRKFAKGRTEVIRTCSSETLAFCQEKGSVTKRFNALQAAFSSHRELVNEATSFNGVDRHLLGLLLIAKENGMPIPEFFSDKGYLASSHYQLSTSNGSLKNDILTSYAPMVEDGYACCYCIRSDTINFGITAWKNNPTTDLAKFHDALIAALCEIRDLIIEASSEAEKSKI